MPDERDLPASRASGDLASYALFAIALFALGLASGEWRQVWPFMLAVMAHPVLAPHLRLRLGGIGMLLLALPFGILYRLLPLGGRVGFLDFSLAFYLSLYLLSLGIVQFYSPPHPGRTPRLILYSGVAMAAMGADAPFLHYLLLVVLYAIALLAALRSTLRVRTSRPGRRRRHAAALAFAALLALALGAAFAQLLRVYENELANLYVRVARMGEFNSAPGFSATATLGDVTRRRADDETGRAVALRVFAEAPPGYLRGKAFLRYAAGHWLALQARQTLPADRASPNDRIGRFVLPGRTPPAHDAPALLRVFPDPRYEAHFFLPLAACAIDTRCRQVDVFPGLSLQARGQASSLGYSVFASDEAVTDGIADPDDPLGADYRQVPENPGLRAALDRVIAALALPPGATPREKVRALASYFARQYRYRIGIEFVTGEDPVAEFLSPLHDSGHCELFAASGTLLLRRMGVPARYVTGFVCEEKNPFGSLYLARDRDAHAWVEYASPPRGWRTAEFTPGDGVPQGGEGRGDWDAFHEYFASLSERAWAFGFAGLIETVLELAGRGGQWLIGSWNRILVLALLFFLFALDRLRRRGARARAEGWPPLPLPAWLLGEERRFRRLERELGRRGLGRRETETLREYADRLAKEEALPGREAALAFLRDYAARRYAPEPRR